MGCTGSKSATDPSADTHARPDFVWPTAGQSCSELMENVDYARQDFERWFAGVIIKDYEESNLNEVMLSRYIGTLWRHIERTVTSDNALHYQAALDRGYKHVLSYSQGQQSVKYQQDRRKLRNHMMLCALDLTGSILVLQPDTKDEHYERRRQSLPIMAWTIVHRIVNARLEAGHEPAVAWCDGLVTRTHPNVISSGRWVWESCSSDSTGAFSKIVDSAADGEKLLLMAVDACRSANKRGG